MAMTAESLRAPLLFVIDIGNGLIQQPIRLQLMKGDKKANTIIVRVMDGNEPVDLTGVTVTGSFIRPPDSAEIRLVGEAVGNEASVLLADECYLTEGYCEIAVKLTLNGTARTILSLTGNVLAKGNGSYVDVGGVIPSIDDIVAQYAEMKRVTEETAQAAANANAAAGRAPYIDATTGTWFVWDNENGAYADTGKAARGEKGDRGDDGTTPHIGENGNWFIGDTDTGIPSTGPIGPQGPKGETGDGLKILGLYETLADLQAAHPTGSEGDAYAVGNSESNVIYLWDSETNTWKNMGALQGPQGPQGNPGDDYTLTEADKQEIAGMLIDDTAQSASKTYSSEKIEAELTELNAAKVDTANVVNNFATTEEGFVADARTVADLNNRMNLRQMKTFSCYAGQKLTVTFPYAIFGGMAVVSRIYSSYALQVVAITNNGITVHRVDSGSSTPPEITYDPDNIQITSTPGSTTHYGVMFFGEANDTIVSAVASSV